MKRFFTKVMMTVMLLMASQMMVAQSRRPIDSEHPLWMIHIDVWNSADPQKIIDLVPDDIKPYVCMNLSLSCQFDKGTEMYRMPRAPTSHGLLYVKPTACGSAASQHLEVILTSRILTLTLSSISSRPSLTSLAGTMLSSSGALARQATRVP